MSRSVQSPAVRCAIRTLAAMLPVAAVLASPAASSSTVAATYQAECGSCHTAYPARLLTPAEWTTVLAALEQHYGTDATLDAASLAAVASHLGARTQPARPEPATALPRITRSHWFLDEHDEVSPAVFQSSAVRSPANCTACHAGADRGDFDDDSVRIPK